MELEAEQGVEEAENVKFLDEGDGGVKVVIPPADRRQAPISLPLTCTDLTIWS